MKYIKFLPLLIFLAACSHGNKLSKTPVQNTALQSQIDSVTRQFAPDFRTVVFKVAAHGNVLAGETTDPAAKQALLDRLNAAQINYVDSISLLPQASLGGKTKAIVSNSVANLRLLPRHQAELTTQATLGTPLTVLKRENGWYFVQTPDKYLSWVDGGAVTWMDNDAFDRWQKAKKLLYKKPYGFAYSKPDEQSSTVADLVFGDVVEIKNQSGDFFEIGYPDGRTAFIHSSDAIQYTEWANSRQPLEDTLVSTAKHLLGLPYLWGGTSFKGVDCSGFTRTVYFMNGLILPRDASQQANIGQLVDTKNGWQQMRPGDLLFFGSPERNGGPAKVTHVGMWIGGPNEFIHSSGRVQINSMNADAANFNESVKRRFLFARHITSNDAAVDLRKTPLFQNAF